MFQAAGSTADRRPTGGGSPGGSGPAQEQRVPPPAALLIVAKMLVFSGLHFAFGHPDHSPIIYWYVVAVVAAFIAFGRLVLKP